MSWIAYVGSFEFPEGQASSQRVLGVSKAIVSAGYNIKIASGSQPSESDGRYFWSNGKCQIQFWGTADHIKYHQKGLQKLSYLLRTGGKKTVQWLNRISDFGKPSAVIYYGQNPAYLRRIKRWCGQNRVTFIVDVVEWYDPRHLGGKYSILNLATKYALRRLVPKADGVIAISNYLRTYYDEIGVNTVRIPILIDSESRSTSLAVLKRPIKLLYAGNSGGGKKDLIDIVISEVAKRPNTYHLTLLGLDIKSFESLPCVQKDLSLKLAKNIEVLGRVSRNEVYNQLAKAHFVPVLREDAIYSKAGFPTKMVEAMSTSTPLIANITGDMNYYLIDGETGVECKTPDEFKCALDRIEEMTSEEYIRMSKSAEKKARDLSYLNFSEVLKEFFKDLGFEG